jgi:GNAT superfamily N-acetyltransferase
MLQLPIMTEDLAPLDIEIRPVEAADIDVLQRQFAPNNALNYHQPRLAVQQRGAGVYLIAWHDGEPIGHFLLRWHGPEDDPTGRYPPGTACLEAGATLPAFRQRGVATRLIQHAERLARNAGHRQIGLAVGSSDNPMARRLYERLGYRDWEQGEFRIQWQYETLEGVRGEESEICIYMFKVLSD